MDNTPIKVLLVEDDEDDYIITRDLLSEIENERFELTWVATYDEALMVIARNEHDVYLLDYRLGNHNGLELLPEAVARGCQAPLILLTGQGNHEIDLEAMKAGAADYLVKGQIGAPLLSRSIRYAIERARTMGALRQAEQRYRDIFEAAPVMYVITRNEGGEPIITDCNQLFLSTLGYSRAEVLERPLAAFYTPASRTKLGEGGGYQRALAGSFVTEERELLTRTGQIVETLLRTSPETDPEGHVMGTRAMFVDITARKRAEEQLHRRNRELALLNQVIAASAAALESEVALETACRELALAFGLPQASVILLNETKTEAVVAAEYLAGDRPPLLHQAISLTGHPSWQYLFGHDTPLVMTRGHSDPRLTSIYDLLSQDGIVSALIIPLVINGEVIGKLCLGAIEPRSFSHDEINLAWSVADQVAGALARTRLTRTHRRLITAVEQSAESMLITDTEGIILYVNPAFEYTSGYSRDEIVGQNVDFLRNGEHDAVLYEDIRATVSAGCMWHGRFVNHRKDATLYIEDASISPVRDESGAIVNYVEVRRDVTRELQLEAQYHQSQKMEAIGQLAGGIAHDFNNLLTVINGYSEVVLHQYLHKSDPSRKFLEEIKKAGERAASLTGQLLAFSRKQVLQPKILDLNQIVMDIDKMLQRLIGEDIEVTTLLASGMAPIKADPHQLEQVLINLAVNARDAMPSGGKLTIETANVTLDLAYAEQQAEVTPGEYVMLAVSDTGIGMPEAVKARIFEPFFTTKEQGKGTGLGLATCFGIIKQSGGHIQVYSELGYGTTFKVYLPCIEAEISGSTKPAEVGKLPYGTETILLVEDEAAVRTLAANVLREQGYVVLEAANGEEALRLIQEQPETEIHLLLTDVVMPQMGGRELSDRLKTVRPDIKVLFTSGYPDDAIVHHRVLDRGVAFLQKPFTLDTFAGKIREVLEASPAELVWETGLAAKPTLK